MIDVGPNQPSAQASLLPPLNRLCKSVQRTRLRNSPGCTTQKVLPGNSNTSNFKTSLRSHGAPCTQKEVLPSRKPRYSTLRPSICSSIKLKSKSSLGYRSRSSSNIGNSRQHASWAQAPRKQRSHRPCPFAIALGLVSGLESGSLSQNQ